MWVLAAYPPTFKTNKIIKKLHSKLKERVLKDDTIVGIERFSNPEGVVYELIDWIEGNLKRNNRYQLLYPYYAWMYTRYAQGKLQQVEDILSKAIPALVDYHKLKLRKKLQGSERDITSIKSLEDLQDLIEKYQHELIDTKSRKAQAKKFFDNDDAELFYEDSNVQVVIPKTKEASCFFGIHTRWCTAAREGNAFESYNRRGGFFYILFKKMNRRYAFYVEYHRSSGKVKHSRSIKPMGFYVFDEKDHQIDPLELRNEYPITKKIFKGYLPFDDKMNNSEKMYYIRIGGSNIKYIEDPAEEMQEEAIRQSTYNIRYIRNPTKKNQMSVVEMDPLRVYEINNLDKDVLIYAIKGHKDVADYIRSGVYPIRKKGSNNKLRQERYKRLRELSKDPDVKKATREHMYTSPKYAKGKGKSKHRRKYPKGIVR